MGVKNTGVNHLSVDFSSYTSEISSSFSKDDDSCIPIPSLDAEDEDSSDFIQMLNFLDHSENESSAFYRTTGTLHHASDVISDVSDELSEFVLDSFSIFD